MGAEVDDAAEEDETGAKLEKSKEKDGAEADEVAALPENTNKG